MLKTLFSTFFYGLTLFCSSGNIDKGHESIIDIVCSILISFRLHNHCIQHNELKNTGFYESANDFVVSKNLI